MGHVPCEIPHVTAYERHRQPLQLQHLQLTLPPCHQVLSYVHHDDLKEDILGEGILVAEDILVDDILVEDTLAAEDILGEGILVAEGNHRAVEDTAPVDIRDDHQNDQQHVP